MKNTLTTLLELDLLLLKMETEQGYIDYPENEVIKEEAADNE